MSAAAVQLRPPGPVAAAPSHARSLIVVMTPAALIAEANDAQTLAAYYAAAALQGIFPDAHRLIEDLGAYAGLRSAKTGPRERARALALHIDREMAAIAAMQRSAS